MILGKLVDTRTRQDLSAEHMDLHNSIDFQKLPFERAIKIVKGNGSRQLALFEDPDCPYCQQLEKDLNTVNDVTIYVFLFPLESIHPNATAHAHAIWCSTDRGTAWTQWMVDHKTPPAGGSCEGDPVNDLQNVAASLHVSSTPTLFLQNGRRVSGAVSAVTLEQLLTAAAAKTSTATAAAVSGKTPAVAGAGRPNAGS
jgi:thiol:disulfide interchange protein DsbC